MSSNNVSKGEVSQISPQSLSCSFPKHYYSAYTDVNLKLIIHIRLNIPKRKS